MNPYFASRIRDIQERFGSAHVFRDVATYDYWEIKVSPTTGYGCYENRHGSERGNLWFLGDRELVAFEGLESSLLKGPHTILPMPVVQALHKLRYHVDPEFYWLVRQG
jgi:hypothetical protein